VLGFEMVKGNTLTSRLT